MFRQGFTLIELLIVIVILAILASLVVGALGGFSSNTFQGEVLEKWTDLDGDGNRVYRVRTLSTNGDVDTWNSYWCHNEVQVGVSYEFKASAGFLRDAKRLAVQPVKVQSQ